MSAATLTIGMALLWILVGCLAGWSGTMFAIWLGEKMRDDTAHDDAYGDWPFIGGMEGEAASEESRGAGGMGSGTADRLGNARTRHDGGL